MSEASVMQSIARLVPHGARVLDLGCGDGALMAHLQATRACTGYGVEIDDAKVLACIQRGVSVLQLNLEDGLSVFEDKSFDVVLQIDTLQHLRTAQTMLLETARVGRIGVVAFPNFAHWPNRLSVLQGRMPVSKTLPHQWFDTPNIRCATLNDFADLAANCGLTVIDRAALHQGEQVNFMPNLRGSQAVFRFAA